jgi:hypothetical protein
MVPATCDPRIPATGEAYFAQFTPDTLALICEAAALEYRLGRMVGIEGGVLWAAVRSIERGEATCPALGGIGTPFVEAVYAERFRSVPAADLAVRRLERAQGMNLLCVLPPRSRPDGRRLDYRRAVTPGVLLAELCAQFEYTHAMNRPLRMEGRDVRAACAALAGPGGFVADEALVARGTVPQARRALYERACERAAYVGTWLVRDVHVAAAAADLRIPEDSGANAGDLLQRWAAEVAFAREQVSGGGCVWLTAFPGPRPWTPSACRMLGVASVVDDIFASPPGIAGRQDTDKGSSLLARLLHHDPGNSAN